MIPRIGTGYLLKPRVFPRKQVSSGVAIAHKKGTRGRPCAFGRLIARPPLANGTFSSPAVADTVAARRR